MGPKQILILRWLLPPHIKNEACKEGRSMGVEKEAAVGDHLRDGRGTGSQNSYNGETAGHS